jgi:hypothetical protein
MFMIYATSSGSFDQTVGFLKFLQSNRMFNVLDRYGRIGVESLRAATPTESGETANSWTYEVVNREGLHGIEWFNTHVNDGVNIAIILQYGHGTGTGGYVEGIDYINPALRPVFEAMVEDIWRQVRNG